MSISDFDDDFDDILKSDNEVPKKPKPTTFINDVKDDDEKDKIQLNTNFNPVVLPPKENKPSNKLINDKLFDDEIDHLASYEPVKSKGNTNKPAKSVLESLLNPSKELNDMNFSFSKLAPQSNSSPNNKIDVTDGKKDDLLSKIEYRPSTGNPKGKESTLTPSNKRTVRFSSEALTEGEIDFESSLNHSRPQTAPNTSTFEAAKPKFFSRFEAAEFEEIPSKSNESIKFINDTDSSLWRDPKSDEFTNISGVASRQNSEKMDVMKNKDLNRSSPKQTLTDFLQSSPDDFLSVTTDKPKSLTLTEMSSSRLSTNFRKNSFEDLLDSRPKTAVVDEFDIGRRASISKDISLERPKTGHSRHDRLQIKSDGSPSMDYPLNDNADLQLKIKHLEAERDDLLYKLEKMVKRNTEEMDMNDKSYKNRIEILEENMKSKEKRLKEEIDLLYEQNKQKLQMLEQERLETRAELTRRQDEIENQKRQEISRIKEQHKLELDKVRLNHEDLISKLQHAKTEEDATLRLAQPTTLQLQSVLTQVSNGAQDLVSIKQQLMEQFSLQIKEKDAQLKDKNDYLKQMEEKLDIQKDENMKERERLQSLISKMDTQLKEQMRTAEEERWLLRQEQNKLAALQSSLEKEREQILIDKDKNHLSHEEFRKRLLDEQKQMFDQIYEEKRSMAEERAKLTREMFKWSESNQQSNVKKHQETAELEGMRAALSEERREIDTIKAQLIAERDEIRHKSSKLDATNYESRTKAEKLNLLEKELNTRQKLLNDKEQYYLDVETRGEDALRKAKDLHSSHEEQLSKMQNQLLVLNEKEQQINKQLIEMERYRKELIGKEKSILCSKCSGSLGNNGFGGSCNNLNNFAPNGYKKKVKEVRNGNKFNISRDHEVRDSVDYSIMVASQMEEERLMHSIKIAAEHDREYLSQERVYLDSLVTGSQPLWKTHVRS